MSSINKRSDLSRIFDLIEDGLSLNSKQQVKKTADIFSLGDYSPKDSRQDYGQDNKQGQTNSQSKNNYMKQKMVNSNADIKTRKQKIIEKTTLDEERNETRKNVSRGKLQTAIVWSEILGQPRCKRRHRRTGRYKYML